MSEIKLSGTTVLSENAGVVSLASHTTQVSNVSGTAGNINFTTPNAANVFTVKTVDAAITDSQTSTAPDVSDSNSGQLAIYNGNTKLWGITEHGFTQNPNVPAFHAFYKTTTATADLALLGTPLIFNYTFLNNQNCYSTSTGYFTSPINGIYHFVFFGIKGSTTTDEGRVSYLINGSPSAGYGYVYPQARGEIDHSFTQMVAAMTVYLNAGDNVRLDSAEGGLYASGSEGNGNNPNWMGYLIG